MLPQKVQQQAHPHLEPVGLPDLEGPLPGDALDPGQILRVLLQDGEGLLPEFLHQPPGGGGPHPLDGPGGQVLLNGLYPHGHPALHDLGLELLPVGGVAAPGAVDGQALPGGGAGHAAHHRHRLPGAHRQAEHGVAILLIAEEDRVHGALQKVQLFLFHGRQLPFFVYGQIR